MDSSRIFVRGLPPNITPQEFQRHFSNDSAVTDIRLIPNRRIGYVGYRSPTDAATAVRYHNKSFMKMSRISVELARPVDIQRGLEAQKCVQHAGPHSSQASLAESETRNSKKRKLDVKDGNKLNEYLEIMQPPSKVPKNPQGKTSTEWQHSKAEALSREGLVDEDQSDQEYEAIPMKRNTKSQTMLSEVHDSQNYGVIENQRPVIEGPNYVEAVQLKNTVECVNPTISDEDWIRSRTSRLLGLEDDDDALAARTLPNNMARNGADIPSHGRSVERRSSDASVQSQEILHTASDDKGTPMVLAQEGQIKRLFIRNLAYTVSEDDLRGLFGSRGCGDIEEVHLPRDFRSGSGKGYAFVRFSEPGTAERALEALDGMAFQGRLLHIIFADPKRQSTSDDFTASKLPLKKQRQLKHKFMAGSTIFNWNSMFMNPDAVMSSISERLGISKIDLLDPTSSDAAVKQAHAETHAIQEAKDYFSKHGVDLETFQKKDRGDTALLVKNFPYEMKAKDLKALFSAYGSVCHMLVPPSGTIAIVGFDRADDARAAFKGLSYKKVRDSVLFLERAPTGLFTGVHSRGSELPAKAPAKPPIESTSEATTANVATLFVRNLSFSTSTDRLREVFNPIDGFLSARVKTKPHPKKSGQTLSMGFGFLEFYTKQQAQAALAAMDGYNLDGHRLLIRISHKALDAAEERRQDDLAQKLSGRKTKIIIKNLPFEVTKKDVRSLFESYGTLRSVRMPKKFDMSTRGFAFAEFVTAKEAENAMNALRNTHLLGRRLVLEFAAEEATDPEREIAAMQRKVGRQADKVALQKLTGTGRKKFNVEEADELQSG